MWATLTVSFSQLLLFFFTYTDDPNFCFSSVAALSILAYMVLDLNYAFLHHLIST